MEDADVVRHAPRLFSLVSTPPLLFMPDESIVQEKIATRCLGSSKIKPSAENN